MGITPHVLSGSTDGRPIKVVATSTPGTTIHTAGGGSASPIDEIFLWATNSSSSAVDLTLEKGGTTDPDDLITQTIQPNEGLEIVLPGTFLTNQLVLKAFAGTGNVVMVDGWILRHT